MRVLNVAEKNDAARSLASIMSRNQAARREGFSKYNKIYDFSCQVFGQSCHMVMTSVSGHLLNYAFAAHYKNWQKHDPLVLFSAQIRKECPANYVDIKRTLQKEIRSCQKLIIWTDCDREGENIGFEVINVCREVKGDIDVYRAVFSEITAAAVNRALQNLVRPDQLTSDAVDVRQELDLRIGAAFTRFQTLRLRQAFPSVLADQLVSYGSCQFPTLGFVVERYKEVENFVSEPFWYIRVTHERKDIQTVFNWKRVRLFNEECVTVLYEYCLESPSAHVTKVNSKSRTRWRPVAMDTVELEKLASRKLRINAKETMRVAEKLYTKGYISYPRTETNIFPKELELLPLVQKQTQDPRWADFALRVVQAGPQPHDGKKTDKAHPPIHPLQLGNNLGGNEARIFELIVRHFLACLSENAKGVEVEVEIDINGEQFQAKGLTILERNYLEVYTYDRWTDKELPQYHEGEEFQPSSIKKIDGATTAPPLLTEADLITLMDKHGIGTDATHAEHIETIKSRSYVGLQEEKNFVPGELGMGLVEGYDAMGFFMSKPHLRAELERDLKLICDGTKRREDVLATHIEKYKAVFIEATRQSTKLFESLSRFFGEASVPEVLPYPSGDGGDDSVVRICSCGSEMTIRRKRSDNGLFVSCSSYPDCKRALWLPHSVIDAHVLPNQLCPNHPASERVHLVALKFSRSDPLGPEAHEGCLECDPELRDRLNLHYSGTSRGSGPVPQRYEAPQRSAAPALPPPPQRPQAPTFPSFGDDVVSCDCGAPARELTVRKEGPNTGRAFFKCSNNQCDFFQWKDDGGGGSRGRGGGSSGGSGGGGRTWPEQRQPAQRTAAPQNEEVPSCNCNQPCKRLVTQKTGPNHGRPFFVCSQPRSSSCNFFLWADVGTSSSSSNARGPRRPALPPPDPSEERSWPPRPAGRTSNGPRAQRAPRRCSVCGQTGHTRNFCPQK